MQVIAWLRRLFRPKRQPWTPLSTLVERAIVVDVLQRLADVRTSTETVDEIAVATRRYVLAMQRHDAEFVEVREATAVEGRLRAKMHQAIMSAGVRQSLIAVVGHQVAGRLGCLEVG